MAERSLDIIKGGPDKEIAIAACISHFSLL